MVERRKKWLGGIAAELGCRAGGKDKLHGENWVGRWGVTGHLFLS